MRFLDLTKKDDGSEEESVSTSWVSVDSFEVFGGVCSDLSDCEYCAERPQGSRYNRVGTPYHSLSPCSRRSSFYSAMDRESAPLLGTAPQTHYDTVLTSDSLNPGELSTNEILSSYNKHPEKPVKSERTKQSSLVTIFSVWNTIMGSSLLTMAWGVERAGLPAALLLVAAMAALCLYTAHVLLGVSKHHGGLGCEVPALCRRLLGAGAARAAHAFSLLVLLGANAVYWILITNFLYFTVNYFVDLTTANATSYNSTLLCPKHDGVNGSLIIPAAAADTPYWGLHTTVPVYVAFIVFPLLNFKDVSFFTKFNSLGTLSVAYLLVFVLVKGWMWGVHVAAPEPRAPADAAALSGLLALSFYIHNIIITIMGNNERQENNGRDLTIAFVLVTITYMLVGAVFYICFPLAKSCIEDNILNNFEMHDVMTAAARVLLLFQVVTVYPLVAFMLRSEMILLLPVADSRRSAVAINVCIVTVCILIACLCPNIGTIIRYTGAISGLVHIFALPSILQVRSLQLRGQLTWWKTTFYSLIVVFGIVNLMMQFFITE